ncbi:hypothetical protein [Faecalibacter rhinopitheci]|uniref:Uncharacterized protein n=1 Tax=Faecalibacter rhinopitheci TaxID=2779678 RepID=A0A8J7K4R7_9FLAO|nr:hypothetical protein [Faecalibacter rhinopitheci]MBF0597964.1 hypothetical protein [Faecalibacter rhinopitheci]MBQ0146831.1 hypothetical protein [Candidatus Onthonaster equi]
MKRVFFEKDKYFDYLFVITNPGEDAEIYKVKNFTDETGHEYVYTLIGERKSITDEIFAKSVTPLPNGKFMNYMDGGESITAKECIESMIDLRSINKENDIYIYIRRK